MEENYYKWTVSDAATRKILGVFYDNENLFIFLKSYYEQYYKEPNLAVTVLRESCAN